MQRGAGPSKIAGPILRLSSVHYRSSKILYALAVLWRVLGFHCFLSCGPASISLILGSFLQDAVSFECVQMQMLLDFLTARSGDDYALFARQFTIARWLEASRKSPVRFAPALALALSQWSLPQTAVRL